MNLFDEQTEVFNPMVHCIQISLPFDEKKVPQWIKDQYGLRHQSAYYLSLLTNALVAVVSEEHGRLCFFRSGEAVKAISVNKFIRVLRVLVSNVMPKEVSQSDECLADREPRHMRVRVIPGALGRLRVCGMWLMDEEKARKKQNHGELRRIVGMQCEIIFDCYVSI